VRKTIFIRVIILIALVAIMFSVVGCGDKPTPEKPKTLSKYDGPFSAVNGIYGGVDDLGRELLTDTEAGGIKTNKTVGLFYFLTAGAGTRLGPYDISEILKKDPEAYRSDSAWIAAGGAPAGNSHWFAKPLFGYYLQNEEWVVRKHIQMFVDSDIDYLILDTTNGTPNTYILQGRLLLKILDEYSKLGYDVPKVAYYTNSVSGPTMDEIYDEIYAKYPEYQYLWFYWDGKPLMIGKSEEASSEIKATFRIKESQWPNSEKIDDGWPWIEFERNMTKDAIFGINGRKEIVAISPAQHDQNWMSTSAFYGGENRSRSWHDGANHITEDSYLYGYNFAEQWEWAIAQDTETIFITQWNEWTATRFDFDLPDQPIIFVDTATIEYSRDIEPMEGGYGDNYYMQMKYYIQKYKGSDARVNVGGDTTIDINGDFSQWDSTNITAVYKDFVSDAIKRKTTTYGTAKNKNDTGRNDILNMKVAKDAANIYFYVDTVAALTAPEGENWMSLFIRSGSKTNKNWKGYDYMIVFTDDGTGLKATLRQCAGEWSWTDVSTVSAKKDTNKIMVSIPKSVLGIAQDSLLNVQFKWADNYEAGNVFSFYTDGDSAPYGRLTYVFSEEKWS